MLHRLLCALSVLFVVGSARAQTPAQFEIASVKMNVGGGTGASWGTEPGGKFVAKNVTVDDLLRMAFGVQQFQVIGAPGWTSGARYDVTAVMPGHAERAKPGEIQSYLQSMMQERFQLKFHRQSREMPVYSMVPAKGGSKLMAHTGDKMGTGTSSGSNKASINADKITTAGLATLLSQQLGQAVLDHTGLDGEFDLKLEWAPNASVDNPLPSIFSAMQEQLGLRLESAKGPVEVIVIDGIEQASAN